MPVLKRILACFLIIAVLSQTLGVVATLVAFQMNRQYYADVLCINKNRPELACQGKCVLMQRLQHDFDQEQTTQNKKLENLLDRDLTLFFNHTKPSIVHSFIFDIVINTILSPQLQHYITQCALCDIFHPPNTLV
jgi:hypothetical protein